MRHTLTITMVAGLAVFSVMSGPAFAETRYENVIGTVTNVETLTNSFTRKTPRDERICQIEEVPVYGEARKVLSWAL